MHGAGNPDPGDDDGDDNKQDVKDPNGGPSDTEQGKGQGRPNLKIGNEEEDAVDLMVKAIARESLLTTQRPADPPCVFKNKTPHNIRIWLMAVQDHLERNEPLRIVGVD